ncbi:MAG: SipW-dependent-type signal peptide-containing protein [Patescibacteria group bacterium]
MKKLLLSVLLIGAAGSVLVSATKAWFTSTVAAEDNEITTGELLLAIDSTRAHSYSGVWNGGTGSSYGAPYDAYNVVRDLDGVSDQREVFEPWTGAEPGVYVAYTGGTGQETPVAGNFSVWLAVRNRGSLPFNYRSYALGEWTSVPRMEAGGTCAGQSPDNNLVKVMNIHRYDVDATTGCNNHEECKNIRDGLMAVGSWQPKSGVGANDSGAVTGYYTESIDLGEDEFVIYRVDLQLDESTDDCYQGATYLYDLVGEAKQLGASW